MERRLGRGLGSLLRETAPVHELEKGPQQEIPLGDLRPNPFQPRQTFDEEGLEELVASLKKHGILQPIAVRPRNGQYEIVAGERRFRAAERAGLSTLPAIVREVSDEQMLELALVENLQRRDLDPIERAEGFRNMQQSLGLTQEEVARRVGLKRATVTNHVRLLELPEEIQTAVRKTLITMGHARAMLGLDKERARLDMLQRTVREDLSVRALEALVRKKQESPPTSTEAKENRPAPWIQEAERRMREHLGARVHLHNTTGYRGRITIDYSNKEALERLLEQLGPTPKL